MKRLIKWGLVLGWMILIFSFSAQNGTESANTSGMIEKLLETFTWIPHHIFGIELHTIIRKGAHFTEYFILALLVFIALVDYFSVRRCLLLAIGWVFLYACTDELHQYFVPGRACLFTDVLIDTSGGALSMFFVFLSYQMERLVKKT